MRIQAKWKNGAFYPIQPLTMKHKLIMIDVPDNEIAEGIAEQEVTNSITEPSLLDRFEQILEPYRKQLAKGSPFTEHDYKEMQHEHLE